MRTVFVSMCAVFALSLAVSLFSMYFQTNAIDELETLRMSAIRELETGDRAHFEAAIEKLEKRFDDHLSILELMASHSDLHEAYSYLVDARISLKYGDGDDAGQALAQMGEALEHIREGEKFSLKNLI